MNLKNVLFHLKSHDPIPHRNEAYKCPAKGKNWARKAGEGRREKAQRKIWRSAHAQNSEPYVCQKQRAA